MARRKTPNRTPGLPGERPIPENPARREPVNPVGNSPFDPPGYNPATVEQGLMESFGPPSAALLQVETDLLKAIGVALGKAGQAVDQIDSHIRTQLTAAQSSPIMATLKVERDLRDGLTQQLANTAELASIVPGDPIMVPEIFGGPTRPLPVPIGPGQPPGGPIPTGPTEPNPPIFYDPPNPPNPPVITFHRPEPSPTGPVYSPNATNLDPTGRFAGRGLPSGPCSPPQIVNNPDGTGYTCTDVALTTYQPLPLDGNNPDPQHCFINANGQLVCHYAWPIAGSGSPGPTPGPSPGPTPTPTTPTPTVCPPPPQIVVQCPPSTPPTPSPTPSPKPPPKPPGTPPDCPPGFHRDNNPVSPTYKQCIPNPIGPPIPPIPPVPLPPEPGPPQPLPGYPPIGGSCGASKHNPCWVASNPPDEDSQDFYVMPGGYKYLGDKGKNIIPPNIGMIVDLPVDANFMQDVGDPSGCTRAWQVSLVSPSGNIYDMFESGILWDKIVELDTKDMDPIQKMLYHSTSGVFFGTIKAVVRLFTQASDVILQYLASGSACMAKVSRSRLLFNWLNVLCMFSLTKQSKALDYSNNFDCPVGLPTSSEAATAWLANEIDECTFQAYALANDNRYELYKPIAKAGKLKFSAIEIKTLDKRHALKRADLATRLRELGSLHAEDAQEIDSLFKYIPGPSDLIRYMVRDVENPNVVSRFRTDEQFTENFQGQLKDWAEQQGVDEQTMRYEWRAHWSIPSPTQLYEVFHRLRHDPTYGDVGTVYNDIKEALIQQDILPFWIDRLLAISFHPLTRTDLNRAFDRGWIDEETYEKGMWANGYSDDDAKQLIRFAKEERKLAIRHSDFMTSYKRGDISDDQFRDLMVNEGYDESLTDAALIEGQLFRNIEQQREQIAALVRQFKACRITDDEFREDAKKLGIPSDLVEWHLDVAEWNTTCGTRRESAAMVCTALDQGLISGSDYIKRMKKLKFDDVAIETMLAVCQNRFAARQAAAQLKAQKAAERAEKAAEKEAEREAKAAQRQLDKVAANLAKVERGRQARNRLIEDATAKLGATLGWDAETARKYVDYIYEQAIGSFGLSQNEAANAVSLAATKWKGTDPAEFMTFALQVAESALKEPWTLFPVG